jgi:ABC-type branched-subunit amino acid transport system substrate-binding protein
MFGCAIRTLLGISTLNGTHIGRALVATATAMLLCTAAGWAATSEATIAVQSSLTGNGAFAGKALVEAILFAVETANAAGGDMHFNVAVYDDGSTQAEANAVAHKIATSDALIVLGPALSQIAIDTCPAYTAAGVAVVVASAHADAITRTAACHRTVISTGDMGDALANYLGHVLNAKTARLIYAENGYGQPLAQRFRETAERLGVAADITGFKKPAERDAASRLAIASQDQPPLILGMTAPDASPLLIALKRAHYRGPIFGTTTMARASFFADFASQPEEKEKPGFFTDGVYATSPVMIDSANAATLAYTARFEAHFGHQPSWESVQADEASSLAMAAIRAALATHPADTAAARRAVMAYFKSLDSPATALSGLAGPIWFTPDRVRPEPVRMGRFHDGLFESAPLQIVPVTVPDKDAIASGAVFDLGDGHYGRLQSVVYTGVFMNEITRIDLPQSSFGADFYLWERYAPKRGPDAADPARLVFPNMVSGSFDRDHPSEQATMPDGTEYRLWRVRGVFRNDFDLRRYPFDNQDLSLTFFNALAASDKIVYVVDRRTIGQAPGSDLGGPARRWATIASSAAFRDLTQWIATGAQERRENLVTKSSLGDERRFGAERDRELSGFIVTMSVQRRLLATLVKSLLPLGLMTLIMFASLYFPHGLVKEKVTVAITAALSGAVLLAAINSQLGVIGYTIAVEYAFYVFFGLSVLCIMAVLASERLRTAHNQRAAESVDRWTRRLFVLAVAVTVTVAVTAYRSG